MKLLFYISCTAFLILYLCLLNTVEASYITQLNPSSAEPASSTANAKPATVPAKRIVSTVLAVDEILSALDLGNRLLAVSHFIDNPDISNCTGLFPSSVIRHHQTAEEILSLKPDLVFVSAYGSPQIKSLLRQSGTKLVSLDTYFSFEDLEKMIFQIGEATGSSDRALLLVNQLRGRIADVKSRVQGTAKPKVLFYSRGGFTAGNGTLIDQMITFARGINSATIAGIRGNNEISVELAVSLKPDVIILPAWRQNSGGISFSDLLDDPRWRDVPAIKNNRVFTIDSRSLETLSQYSANGLEAIARVLHPEVF